MSFVDCINTAAETGRLSRDKQAEATRAFNREKEASLAAGLGEDAAENAAAQAALKATTTLVYDKRKARIHQMRKQHDLHMRVQAAPNPVKEYSNVALELADIHKAVLGQLARVVDNILLKYGPKWAGLHIPTENMDEIVDGIYGKAVGEEASAMAKATRDFIDLDRKLLNLEGASIPDNPNFRLWQSHEPTKVHAAGEDYWVARHLEDGVLDWEIMRYAGRAIPVDKREAILREVYKGIVTSGRHREKAGQANTESLATRLSRERFLYYKTAEAWKAMQKEFGTGNFFHQLVEHMESGARNVSLMRVFGANPGVGKAFLERAIGKRVAEMKLANTNKRAGEKLEAKEEHQRRQFDAAYAIHARDVDTGAGNALAMTSAIARTWSTTALLGSAIISNLSDPVFGMWMRGANRIPQISTIPRYFSAIANYKDFRQQMIDNAIIVESLINRAWEGNRINLAAEGSKFVRNISDINYRMQGLSAWTNIGRGVAGLEIAQVFARVRDMAFDEVPFVHLMRTVGITAQDWDNFRATQLYEPEYYGFGKGKMMRPVDFYEAANTDALRASAEKFLMFQETVVRGGIPSPTLPAKAFLGEHLPASQVYTQFFKSMTQLMLFPATMHFQYWKKIIEAPRYRDKLWRTATFIAYTTAAGAMVTQLKDVLSGKQVHPMDTKEFWIRAMLNGGAGGILGDFLYDGGMLIGSPYGANTPLGQQLDNFKRLTLGNAQEALAGEELHFGADASRFAWGLFPFKVPGIKLVVERSLMDALLEQSDPAAYARKLQAQQQWEADQGQGTWWGVGEEPDLGKLFGG